MTLACGFCGDLLNVGTEARAVVALCIPGSPKATIRACDNGLWGSPSTRFECASTDGEVRHVVQTDPPAESERRS